MRTSQEKPQANQLTPEQIRMLLGDRKPKNKFEAASRQAFINSINAIMQRGGVLKKL